MHCLPQTFFETFSSGGSDPGEEVDPPGSEEKIQELLILAFEVIVQPPKQFD